MKELLKLRAGTTSKLDPKTNKVVKTKLYIDSDYYSPYIIHDTVEIYDKSQDKFTSVKRTTGISFGVNGDIVVAFAYCSPKDTYNKQEAKNIVTGRIVQLITHKTTNSCFVLNTQYAYYFKDLPMFNEFADACSRYTSASFMPMRVKHSGKNRDSSYNNTIVTSKDDTTKYHWHIGFVNDTYLVFYQNIQDNIVKDQTYVAQESNDIEEAVQEA